MNKLFEVSFSYTSPGTGERSLGFQKVSAKNPEDALELFNRIVDREKYNWKCGWSKTDLDGVEESQPEFVLSADTIDLLKF